MDRPRFNGTPQDSAPAASSPTNQTTLDRRTIAKRFELVKNELDQLQNLTLNFSGSQEIHTEVARKYTMYYEVAHSLYNHIQQQKELCRNAIKLVADIFSHDENIRQKHKSDLQHLKMAYEELTSAEAQLKPQNFPDQNFSQSNQQPSSDLNNGSGTKRSSVTSFTDNRSLNRPKNQRVDVPLKFAQVPDKGDTIPATTNHETLTYSQLNQLQSSTQAPTPTASRHIASPPIAQSQAVQSLSSPPLDLAPSKGPYSAGLTEATLDPSKNQLIQATKSTPGLNTLYTLHHGDVVCSITSSGSDANFVYTGGLGSVKLWDRSKHASSAALSLESMDNYIRACRISPDGKTLVVGGESDKIVLWDISQSPPASLACFVATSNAVYAMTFSPCSRYLYSCGSGGDILIWDLAIKKRIKTLSGHNLGVTCIDITPNGKMLVSGGLDKSVRLWDLTTFTQIACCNLSSPIFSLGLGCFSSPFNDADAVVIAGAESSLISVLPLAELSKNGTQLATNHETFSGHATCVISLKFSPDRRHFVSTGKEGLILGWKLASSGPSIVKQFVHQETASVLSCDISRSGKFLITGSGNKYATVYQLQW